MHILILRLKLIYTSFSGIYNMDNVGVVLHFSYICNTTKNTSQQEKRLYIDHRGMVECVNICWNGILAFEYNSILLCLWFKKSFLPASLASIDKDNFSSKCNTYKCNHKGVVCRPIHVIKGVVVVLHIPFFLHFV